MKQSPFSIFNSQFSINMSELDLYISLFITFFKIGLFGFGGGYAMLSLIQHDGRLHGHRGHFAKHARPHRLQHRHLHRLHGNRQHLGICHLHNSRQSSLPDHHDHDLQVLFHVPGQQIRGNGHARFKNHCFRTYWGSSIVIDEQAKLRGLQKLYYLRHSLHRHLQIQNGPDTHDHSGRSGRVSSLLEAIPKVILFQKTPPSASQPPPL